MAAAKKPPPPAKPARKLFGCTVDDALYEALAARELDELDELEPVPFPEHDDED